MGNELPSQRRPIAVERSVAETRIPPLNWFAGVGRQDRGIIVVFPSDEFKSLGNGEVGIQMNGWGHWTGNPLPEDEADRARIQAKIAAAEAYIKEVTGFTPQEIDTRQFQLQQEYRGKTEAPFQVILGPS